MSDSNVMEQLAAFNSAVQAIPIPTGGEAAAVLQLQEVKRALDDVRLGLWSRLKGAHSKDARAFEEQFRVRRATELCLRLTSDLRSGLMNPGHQEYDDLWIAAVELGQAIQSARTGAGRSDSE
jgi:hypothetical protein